MKDASRPALSARGILDRTFLLFRLAPHRVALALVIPAGLGTAVDSGMVGDDGAYALNVTISFLVLILQYWIIRSLLQDLGYRLPERPRFPAFFLMGLLTSLVILIGLAALVVPGVILMVRWSISAPLVIGSEGRVVAAIAESWRATEGNFWPILLAFGAIYASAVAIVVAGAVAELVLEDRLAGAAILNVGLNAGFIAGWHAVVAVYVQLRAPQAPSEAFE